MSYKSLTQDTIAEQLNCQIRGKLSGWAYLIIPVIFFCVIILLWILMLIFGGELAPKPHATPFKCSDINHWVS